MIVSDFTVPELNLFREQCNFIETERQVFEYRSQDVPLEEIAEILNMSVTHIGRISQKVNKKIKKVQFSDTFPLWRVSFFCAKI